GVIYLSGGNTYMFLNDARKRSLYKILRKHLQNGGLLLGASAGALMMTPSIDIAEGFDENIFGLIDVKGFAFVPFEFFPHFEELYREYIDSYMKNNIRELYLCRDGDGIFCGDDGIKIFGNVSKYTVY
nr:Type 1 glutamine amidotransferase-like domain-containing protein [Candidatus Paceibacterota bacterium]